MIDDPVSLKAPCDFTNGIVVGLGARAQATAPEIIGLIDAALREHGLTRDDIRACTTSTAKQGHKALIEVATLLNVPLLCREISDTAPLAPTPSDVVRRHIGLPSVAEAAALTFGPLLAPKRASANVTCALASLYPARLSTSSAAPTLSTSRAGS